MCLSGYPYTYVLCCLIVVMATLGLLEMMLIAQERNIDFAAGHSPAT